MKDSHRIPFALSAEGRVVSVVEVERGLACKCVCPACKAPLVARKGEARKRVWHFAHHSGASCAGALETSLHVAGKELIAAARCMRLPACSVVYGLPDLTVRDDSRQIIRSGQFTYLPAYRGPDRYCDDPEYGLGQFPVQDVTIVFDEVFLERTEGDIRPDIVGIVGGERLYVEIAVSHFVDAAKLAKIRRRTVPTLEVEIAYQIEGIDWDSFRNALIEGTSGKYWMFQPKAEQLAEEDFVAKEHSRRMAREVHERQLAERQQAYADRSMQYRSTVAQEQALKDLRNRVLIKRIEAQKAQPQIKTEEDVEAAIAALYEFPPSPDLPVGRLPVIFLDYDSAAGHYGNRSPFLQQLEECLRDRPCSIVVTSDIRHSRSETEIVELFEYFGGRHVSCTPILDRTDPYGNRQREIDAWLANRNVTNYLIINRATMGFARRPLSVKDGEACEELPERIWRWMVNSRLA